MLFLRVKKLQLLIVVKIRDTSVLPSKTTVRDQITVRSFTVDGRDTETFCREDLRSPGLERTDGGGTVGVL